MTSSNTLSLPQLRARFNGTVIAPGDESYDVARQPFYGGIDRRPAVIIRPPDAAEVAHVVTLARETGLELAVRSGGHSIAGHSVSEGGIVLDLSLMKGLDLDVGRRRAWAETGLTAAEFTTAAGAHGLATGFGDAGLVGIGGITLGGGVGFFLRKHGLTIDSLEAADIVTADGELLRTDPETHPDLFWAIRGGGGNFGVATRFQFRLHEVGTVVGGMLMLPATPDIIADLVEIADAAPEELSVIANVMVAPPMPFVPPEHHGRLVIMALVVHAGPTDAGEAAIAPFRALAKPIVDMVRPMPFPEMYEQGPEGYHPKAVGRTMFVDAVDRDAASTMVDYLHASTAPMRVVQLRVLGGAMARVPSDATAFAHREQRIMVNVGAVYEQPEEAVVHEAWAGELAAALNQGYDGAYINFLGDEGPGRVRAAYPGSTWDRLSEIKRRYDPTNLFRLNHNVPPAADGH